MFLKDKYNPIMVGVSESTTAPKKGWKLILDFGKLELFYYFTKGGIN